MDILSVILKFVLVIVCFLLVGVILLQRNKGAGAGVTFGGGEAVFGADMGNVLTRSTIVLGILFLTITITLSIINAHKGSARGGSVVDGIAPVQSLPAAAPAEALPEDVPDAVPVISDEAADAPADAPAVAEAAADAAEAAPEATPAAEAPAPEAAPAADAAPAQ